MRRTFWPAIEKIPEHLPRYCRVRNPRDSELSRRIAARAKARRLHRLFGESRFSFFDKYRMLFFRDRNSRKKESHMKHEMRPKNWRAYRAAIGLMLCVGLLHGAAGQA